MCAEPVRYTAATMEMMRLEDLQHIKCGVNYAQDHSHGRMRHQLRAGSFARYRFVRESVSPIFTSGPQSGQCTIGPQSGHGDIAISRKYFAEKEWATKDQAKNKRLNKAWRRDPSGMRTLTLRKAEKALKPP